MSLDGRLLVLWVAPKLGHDLRPVSRRRSHKFGFGLNVRSSYARETVAKETTAPFVLCLEVDSSH